LHDQLCQNCSLDLTCASDSFLIECLPTQDAKCKFCTRCSYGWATAATCNDTVDTQCALCAANGSITGLLPDHANWVDVVMDTSSGFYINLPECYWECGGGSFHDTLNGVCKFCDETCVVGEYQTECTVQTGFRGCMPCEIPENAIATDVGRKLPNSCPWECANGTSLVIVSSDRFACEAISTPAPPVVVVPCTLDRLDCEMGQVFSSSACACLTCRPLLNTSSIAVFTMRGSCRWVCLHPFTQVNGHCDWLTVSSQTSGSISGFFNATPTIVRPQIGLISLTILPFIILFGVACYSLLR